MSPADPARDTIQHVPPDLAGTMVPPSATGLPPSESLVRKRLRKFAG